MAASPLWALRDDRSLSAYAKLAYVMLWTRRPDCRPSMTRLAGDMGVSARTARNAVRELERVGVLKTVPRISEHGDPDTNQYELLDLEGPAPPAAPPGTARRTGTAPDAAKESNPKYASEGRNRSASRRAQAPLARAEVLGWVRRAITLSYSSADAEWVTDGQCIALWYQLIGSRRPADPVAYFCKIFDETPHLDIHLANAGDEEDWSQ